MTADFRLSLAAESDNVGAMIDAIEAFLGDNRISEACVQHIGLVLDELLANIASHGAPFAGDPVMEVALSVNAGTVVFCVSDNGHAFNPLLAPDPDVTATLEERDPGGLGILLVRKLMNDVAYRREDGINRLTLTKIC